MEFLNWEQVGTFAGAMTAVVLLTELVKGLPILAKIPTRLISWALAYAVLLAAQAFGGALTVSAAVLSIFNAAMVSLAANGEWDALKKE